MKDVGNLYPCSRRDFRHRHGELLRWMFFSSMNRSGMPLTKPTISARRRYSGPRIQSSRTARKWLFSAIAEIEHTQRPSFHTPARSLGTSPSPRCAGGHTFRGWSAASTERRLPEQFRGSRSHRLRQAGRDCGLQAPCADSGLAQPRHHSPARAIRPVRRSRCYRHRPIASPVCSSR